MTANPLEKQTHTIDDLLALPDDGKRYELIEGEIVEMGTSSRKHTILGTWLLIEIGIFLRANKIGGQLGGADGTYKLDAKNTRVPDVSYLTADNAAKLPAGTVYCPFAPDFVVEVQSPSNSDEAMRDLAQLYIRTGSRLVWTIHPVAKIVMIYRPGQPTVELTEKQVIDGGDVLPGLKIALADMFAEIEGL